MSQKNDNSKILAALIVGVFTVIIGWVMLNIAVGIIGGIAMFVFLISHDD